MLRLLPVLIFIMFLPTISLAQEVEFSNTQNLKSLMKELGKKTEALDKIRSKKIAELEEQYKSRLKETQDAAVRELNLLQKRVAAENLDEAVKIRDAAKSIGKPSKDKTPPAQDKAKAKQSKSPPNILAFSPKWKGGHRLLVLLPDGTILNREGNKKGKWRIEGKQLTFVWQDVNLPEPYILHEDGSYSGKMSNGKKVKGTLLYGSPDFFKE